jgi:hypothetical protein
LIDRAPVALYFSQTGVAGDGSDLVRCTSGFGKAPYCRFARVMEESQRREARRPAGDAVHQNSSSCTTSSCAYSLQHRNLTSISDEADNERR